MEKESPEGVIVQFGGQTPLNLARAWRRRACRSSGPPPRPSTWPRTGSGSGDAQQLGLRQPENGTARSFEEAEKVAERIGYPVVVRPCFVLGGRAMEIVYDESSLRRYMTEAVEARRSTRS